MYNADVIYNYTLKYMILRQSILSIDKIFKEITVSECEKAKIFLSSFAPLARIFTEVPQC